MKRRKIVRRGRASASLVAAVALFGGAAAVVGGPTASALPAPTECPVAVPVEDLTKGDLVEGLTVSSGTTPEPFTGEILGVLHDGIAPGVDMVLAELDSAALQKAGGIWQGMSGSPVYADPAHKKLIGAVAYGLSWGPSMVAGITPFEEMDDHLPAPLAGRVRIDARAARVIATGSDVTAAQAEQGFSQLRMPMGISGFGARQAAVDRVEAARLLQQERHAKYLPRHTFAMASGGVDTATRATVVDGGNLAVSESYGDITMGGVGTATSVCNGGVVGFGHPATFRGDTTMSMHPADALFVQPESLGAPFKVANFGEPVGSITGDHLAGIDGMFGDPPAAALISSAIGYRDRNRTGTTKVTVPDAAPAVTFYQQLANHDRVLDSYGPGSELLTWRINGKDSGRDFAIGMTDRYASDSDIAFEAPWDVADTVWMLTSLPGVDVTDVTMTAEVVDDPSVWRVSGVEQRRGGEWVKVARRTGVVATAGQALRLRAVLETTGAVTRYLPVSVDVPAQASGSSGYLRVVGGASTWPGWRFGSVDDVAELVGKTVRNDAVQAELGLEGRRRMITWRAESKPTDKVVRGSRYVAARVR